MSLTAQTWFLHASSRPRIYVPGRHPARHRKSYTPLKLRRMKLDSMWMFFHTSSNPPVERKVSSPSISDHGKRCRCIRKDLLPAMRKFGFSCDSRLYHFLHRTDRSDLPAESHAKLGPGDIHPCRIGKDLVGQSELVV